MATRDGNGWVQCRCGSRHWGLFGAAGLLLHRPGPAQGEVLMQLRAPWVHQGGTWAAPGGAADSHEDAVTAALREAEEEAGVSAAQVEVLGLLTSVDHGDWAYHVVLARSGAEDLAVAGNCESEEMRWVSLESVGRLPLHPAFAASWPTVRSTLVRLLAAQA